ncbi:MAG: hypothetical protein M3Q00_00315 [Pseudomonadota bacterium]|nr:hypothetical protein [Pseudomonadota bacterium]
MATIKEAQEALLKKVDTLLNRHRAVAAGLNDPAHLDVPVLTDMIDDDAPALKKSRVAHARPGDKALHGLAADIYERVLEKLDERIAAQFERRLASKIEHAIHAALLKVGADLKQDLMNSVGDVIAEALAEKLNHSEKASKP